MNGPVVIVPASDHVDVAIFTAFFLYTHAIFFLPSESTCQQVRAFCICVLKPLPRSVSVLVKRFLVANNRIYFS